MKYCSRCVQPDSRPGVFLDARGVCSACVGHEEKEKINWDERKNLLAEAFDRHRDSGGGQYDCIIPVSGGKDSTYQTYVAKELFGMNPLCVAYRTPLRTALGQRNLDNMQKRLKVDLLELTVSPETERKFILKAMREVGDCGLPQHLGIFSFTLRMATQLGIKLVVWGENSPLEYGGAAGDRSNPYLTREWAAKYGCLKGKMAEDWVDESLTLSEMRPFVFPTDTQFEAAKTESIFLGHYLKWDPVENAQKSQQLGFEFRKEGPVMGIWNFADLDCKLISSHHYPKWYKFGMTRTFDNVSVEIRNGRMSRDEAIEHIRRNRDDRPIPEHLGALCEFLQISEADFFEILEPFRNLDIWKRREDGEWHIPDFICEMPFAKEK